MSNDREAAGKPKGREALTGQLDDGSSFIACKLDMSDCDHDFPCDELGNQSDICEKCGTSVWAMAFMEMP